MKVSLLFTPAHKPGFKGVREDRNTVSQLKENNNYSLNEPNQRRINKAIENLSKQRGEENIQFLLNVGENIKYQTNIDNGKLTKNDWKSKLKGAAEESLAHSNPILKEKYQPEIDRVFSKQPLTKEEETIKKLKTRIMNRVGDAKERGDIDRNLDYFITSTETSTAQKKYIMGRFDYLMSPRYDINPQLKDKKAQVLSELANDIVINTPESKIPNTKHVNQKTHGMCAAISIARKSMAYEDKPNYVDAVLEELKSGDTMMVYDIQNLGKKKRIPIKKAYIDFDYATDRGYRIVDASTLQWMNAGGMYGVHNEQLNEYNAFDKSNFDAFHDSYFLKSIDNNDLAKKQLYYQSLVKAKDTIGSVKSRKIKSDIKTDKQNANFSKNIDELKDRNEFLKSVIREILPNETDKTINKAANDLLQMEKPLSADIEKNKDSLRKYSYIPNEENSQKIKKISEYFIENYKGADKDNLSEKADKIVYGVSQLHQKENEINPKSTLSDKIRQARSLYEAEATYRAANLIGFLEPDNQTDYLVKYNIPDRETRLIKGLDKIINRIEKHNDKVLINHFANSFGYEPEDKENILTTLHTLKSSVEDITTIGLDGLYESIGVGDRHTIIVAELGNIKDEISKGDKDELKRSAECLKVKADKNTVLKEYDKLEKKLIENPDNEEIYTEVINKLGNKNQLNMFVDVFKQFTENIAYNNPERDLYIEHFCNANGLAPDSSEEVVLGTIQKISDSYDKVSQSITATEMLLNVPKVDGTYYFTVSAPAILMKKLENEGKLIPESTMEKLQTRFAKIDKLRSSDEFSSRQGKISDPSLYKLTKEENDAIKKIDKKVNMMYADVSRNLNYQYREIKEPLEKLANYVGTNSGHYWVSREGNSGMESPQQVRILEQLTDRPYKIVKDLNVSSTQIKNGPHSGVSGSSVFHDKTGWHAQYIADIKENEENGKDILFHDNTWGASEHENTWVDSEGLTRTDYSDNRGGELGYITDENYRNGNYLENLTNKKGHNIPERVENRVYNRINNSGGEYDFQLLYDTILPGSNPKYKDIALGIKDAIYMPDSKYLKVMTDKISKMSYEEAQKNILRNKTAGLAYKAKFDKIMNTITPSVMNKGITTREDYDKLSENDIVKIYAEKVAVKKAYADGDILQDITKAKTMDDIKKVRAKQRRQAYSNFKYAFSKTFDNFYPIGLDHGKEMTNMLMNALKNNNLPVEKETCEKIMSGLGGIKKVDKDKFDGSLKHSIDIIINRAEIQFDENMPENENTKKAKEEFLTNLRKVFTDNMYFDSTDLKSNNSKAVGIRKWIDRKFEPKTDEEFIEIYRNIQDMTSDELRALARDIKPEELGIKNISGFDIISKINAADDNMESSLRNTVFYDEYAKDMEETKTKPSYSYGKVLRTKTGSVFPNDDSKRTFDDLYRQMWFTLMSLDYEKAFNKYKDDAFRKYGALPAYPKMNLDKSGTNINHMIDIIEKTTDEMNVKKSALYNVRLVHKFGDYLNNIPKDKELTNKEKETIAYLMNDFLTHNKYDTDMEETLKLATQALSNKDSFKTLKDYDMYLEPITTLLKSLESINSEEDFEESIKDHKKYFKTFVKITVDANVPDKYKRVIYSDINNLAKLEINARKPYNSYDVNKDIDLLEAKITNSTNSEDKKAQIEYFIHILNMVSDIKTSRKSLDKPAEEIDAEIIDLDKNVKEFVDKYIIDDKKNYIKENLNDYIRSELADAKHIPDDETISEQIEKSKKVLLEDMKKFGYINNSTDLLEKFVLSYTKDAPEDIGKNKDLHKDFLTSQLNLARFIEIQELLMDAQETGNPALVQNYFKNYYVNPYNDPDRYEKMDSDGSLDFMIQSLIVEGNTKTAKMFVEKLGLGDKILKLEKDNLDYMKPKKIIDEVVDILERQQKLTSIVQTEYTNFLENVDTGNLDKLIKVAKKNIREKTKDFKDDEIFKNDIKMYTKALDNGKIFVDEHPEIPKNVAMAREIQTVMQSRIDEINKKLQDKQSTLSEVNLLYKFLTDLHLPEYSKGYKIQQQLKQDYDDLTKYNNDKMRIVLSNRDDLSMTMDDY